MVRGYVTAEAPTKNNADKGIIADFEKYGNYSVYMADTKDGGNVFEAYQVKPVDGKTVVKVGDFVEVIGEITKFYETVETVGGGVSTIEVVPTTAVEEVKAEAGKAVKVVENGQLVIIRDGVRYNAVGAVIE